MKRILTTLGCLLLFAGCAHVPETQISIPTPNGAWMLKSPKDNTWSNVVVTAKPDGSFSMQIGTVTSKNDADVIAAVAAQNAAMADKAMTLGTTVIQAGAAAVAKGAAAGIAP